MSRKEKSRIRVDGGNSLGANPFEGLGTLGNLPPQPSVAKSDKVRVDKAQAGDTGGEAMDKVQTGGACSSAIGKIQMSDGAGSDAIGEANKLSATAGVPSPGSTLSAPAVRSRGRIDVRREKSGRGGKVVTVVGGERLAALGAAERDALLRQLKNRFGCGGRHGAGFLELQGNLVEQLQPVLTQMGWRVVRTGG